MDLDTDAVSEGDAGGRTTTRFCAKFFKKSPKLA